MKYLSFTGICEWSTRHGDFGVWPVSTNHACTCSCVHCLYGAIVVLCLHGATVVLCLHGVTVVLSLHGATVVLCLHGATVVLCLHCTAVVHGVAHGVCEQCCRMFMQVAPSIPGHAMVAGGHDQ